MAAAEVLAVVFLWTPVLVHFSKKPRATTEIKTAPVLFSDLLAGTLAIWLVASVLTAGRIRIDRTTTPLAGFILINVVAISVAAVRFGLTLGQVAFSSLYLVRWSLYAVLYLFALTVLRRGAASRLTR